jgi:cyanophycinase
MIPKQLAHVRLTCTLVAALACQVAFAEVPAGVPASPEQPLTGALVIAGGGELPAAVLDRFVELAGGRGARLVVIPTASQTADTTAPQRLLAPWNDRLPAAVELLHTRSRTRADEEDFVAPLRQATGVWLGGGDQSRLAAVYLGTAVERELKGLLARGGVIGGTSAGAAVMSRLMIAGGTQHARLGEGFGLLSTFVIDQHFLRRNRTARLLGVLEERPGYVGLGIDEGTAVVIRGRELSVLGASYAVVCLPRGDSRPVKLDVLGSGDRRDLVALSRAALERARATISRPSAPVVSHRKLIIGGGTNLGPETYRRFIDLAGGPHAKIVLIATAVEPPVPPDLLDVERLRDAGALNLQVLDARTPAAASDKEFLASLEKAGGIWFTGGRQWRLVDAYLDTPAEEVFHAVLQRGGVIGGSSAGASIQASYLVRGSPLGNEEMMAEGYERGFGFLPGTAIDQHFSQRDRRSDLQEVINAHPELLGIGIDERTAIVVSGSVMEVIGENSVSLVDGGGSKVDGQAPMNRAGESQTIVLKRGGRFDWMTRVKLSDTGSD